MAQSRSGVGRAFGVAVVAAGVFSGLWIGIHFGPLGRDQIRDTPRYEVWGRAMMDGKVPYRDFAVEYPPGALPAFALPAAAAGPSHRSFERWFELMMASFGIATIVAVALTLERAGMRMRLIASRAGFVALMPLMLGTVILSRFDLWPAALAAGGAAAALAEMPLVAGVLLGVGAATKVYPLLLVPFAAVYLGRRRRRAAWTVLLSAAAAAAAVVGPFLLIARHGLTAAVSDQASRPLQIESLGASLALAAHQVYGQSLGIDFSHSSQNLGGSTFRSIATGQVMLQAITIVALFVAFARGPALPQRFLRYVAAVTVGFVVFGKVLSPQYLVWIVPPVAVVAGRRGRWAVAVLGAALIVTQVWFPRRYWRLVFHFDGLASWAVLTRNLLLLALLAVLAVPEGGPPAAVRRRLGLRSV